jgi:cytochrome c-type biogenesis protein
MSLDVSAGGAFLAGLLSFFSPCVLPLVPPYLAYMGGVSIEELRADGGARARLHVLAVALAFVAGFSTVFVALGATASWVGQAVGAYLGVLGSVAGALIMAMGLHFLGVLRIPFLDHTARVGVAAKPAGLAGAYVIGLAFGFGWSPCVGPVLAAILLIAGAQESAGEGARLLLIYSLGIGVPFLVAAWFAGAFMHAMARLRGRLGIVEKVMGAFLIVAGLLIFTGQMPTIANWMIETFPALGKIG